MSILLNGFKIELSAPTFTAYVEQMPNNKNIESIREKHQDDCFIYWHEGQLFVIPKTPESKISIGEKTTLQCEENLKLLVARVNHLLPTIVPDYNPVRFQPVQFLAKKTELVKMIIEKQNLTNYSQILENFKIIPKYTLEARLIELRPNEVFISIFLCLGTNWKITASLSNLQAQGVNLRDLYVVRRQCKTGERRLVGKIDSLTHGIINLSESYNNLSQIHEDEIWLEGSKASFSHCLKALLGNKYYSFEREREREEGNLLIGTGQYEALKKIKDYLKKSPLFLTPDLQGNLKEQIEINNDENYTTMTSTSTVEYCFDSARTKKHKIAWYGIRDYGPFSREVFSKKSPNILVFFPDTIQGKVEIFLKSFQEGISIKEGQFEKSSYSGGFAKIFCLTNPKFTLERIAWHENKDQSPAKVYKAYRKTIEQILSKMQEDIDAAIVIILDEHSNLPDSINPYLHSKSLLLTHGIPVQEIRYSNIQKDKKSLQYILQNFSLAMYAKLTGQPWTVDQDQTISDELVIGIGTSELSNSRFETRQRFVGITTVFRGDGNYLLSSLSKECSYDEYPDVLRESTISILQEFKRRNGWQPGDTVRLIFHSARPLKKVNIAKIISECVEEVGKEQIVEFAFLTVSEEHPFIVLDTSQQGYKGKGIYAPERGKIIQIGKYNRLLSTNSPHLIKKETSPIPRPLLIRLHQQSNYRDLTYLSEQVLKFTALSWRSTFPAPKPVSIYYSELIANLLGRLKNIEGWSSIILNTKLRASKWFL
ncbi:stem cell self-renewal protein Piwi domain protein [Rippkaea orientalis PCC 8801]|uniref:Protein argonaute n=1 Tax=Rippkaea orientalis (strain PCC 8801 / RF-1) TaxID=41431 RepID=B7K585_RIPO1|nr:Piwi domain-containing protein [Rippkaea orientalis]ACK67911.1 stem cell self-renewal protein Piwi domain protein [Rippkaea orientalis PCC 8801]